MSGSILIFTANIPGRIELVRCSFFIPPSLSFTFLIFRIPKLSAMIRRYLFSLLFIFSGQLLCAQLVSGYYAMGGGSFIYNGSFSSSTAYIINGGTGGTGRLYKSSDHCLHWRPVIDSTLEMLDVAFMNPDTGIVGCEGGKILVTHNGGLSFSVVQVASTTTDLARVIWGGRTAFAISYNGPVYRSSDYGLTWVYASGVGTCNSWGGQIGTCFLNDSVGFVLKGLYGNGVCKTTNGGQSWTVYSTPGNTETHSIFMNNDSIGYVSGEAGKVFKTTNHGVTWTLCGTAPVGNDELRDLHFISVDTGFAVYDHDVFRTVNGGGTWSVIYNSPVESFNEVEISADGTMYVLGGYGVVYVSFDLGQTWNHKLSSPSGEMAFVARDTGFSTSGGCIVMTDDAGYTWRASSYFNSTYIGLYTRFPDRSHGFVAGNIGISGAFFARSTDGGSTWSYTPFGSGYKNCRSMSFYDSLTGFISMQYYNQQVIMRTVNGGITWQQINPPLSGLTRGFYFLSADTVFGVESNTGLYVSYNQGNSWSPVSTPTPQNSPPLIGDIEFVSEDTGYLHMGRYILKTTNRGQTWDSLLFHPFNGTTAIEVKGDTILAGSYYIWRSTDEGASWQTFMGPQSPLSSIWQLIIRDTILYVHNSGGNFRSSGFLSMPGCNISIQGSVTSTCDSAILTANIGPPLQWWLNGNPLPGETNDTLILPGVINGDLINISTSTCVSSYVTLQNPPEESITAGAAIIFCPGDTVQLNVSGTNTDYLWSTGDTSASIPASQPGPVSVIFTDQNGCVTHDTIDINNYYAPPAQAGPDTSFCQGQPAVIGSSQNYGSCLWTPFTGLSSPTTCTPVCTPQSATNYILTVTTNDGCISSDTVLILPIISPAPSISWVGDTLTCSAGLAYQWYLNNNPVPGATNQTYVMLQNGTYKVDVLYSNGCWRMSGNYNATGVSVDEVSSEENSVLIFPNPSGGTFDLLIPASAHDCRVRIFNSLGECVWEKQYEETTGAGLSVHGLVPGIYIVSVEQNGRETRIRALIY